MYFEFISKIDHKLSISFLLVVSSSEIPIKFLSNKCTVTPIHSGFPSNSGHLVVCVPLYFGDNPQCILIPPNFDNPIIF